MVRRDASLIVPHLKLEAFLIPLFCPIRVRTPFKHHMTRCQSEHILSVKKRLALALREL